MARKLPFVTLLYMPPSSRFHGAIKLLALAGIQCSHRLNDRAHGVDLKLDGLGTKIAQLQCQ